MNGSHEWVNVRARLARNLNSENQAITLHVGNFSAMRWVHRGGYAVLHRVDQVEISGCVGTVQSNEPTSLQLEP